ncbi:serine/threonine protein kinase [Singulisphaera sp. GP187]|uniref:serine/threonine-protein kinase n=1 Tax=Singulisphaera sp. GP187 TaxID=1882752 RepID=UPI00092C4E49|nr:serine/threonine-protein kinase [Singulisphaera sp. GP187]SIO62614.1 serine/threonine protein kinase [Singulisphaera sp. GP187]
MSSARPAPVELVADGDRRFADEERTFLHVRLRAVTFLLSAGLALVLARDLTFGRGPAWPLQAAATVAMAFLATLLSAARTFSTRGLKLMEVAAFGLAAVVVMIHLWHAQLSATVRGDPTSLVAGSKDAVIGATIVMFTYALLVPAPYGCAWRAIAAIAACPVATEALLFLVHPEVFRLARRVATDQRIGETMSLLATSALLAAYGAYLVHTMRVRAREARQFNQYRLRDEIGAGGMGAVYLAEHRLLKRPCALKVILPERAGDPRSLERFEQEVRATAQLSDPHIVEVYDYGRTEDGTFFYVMEYLHGLSLDGLVGRHGPLPPGRVIYLLRQVCQALAEAHAAGLVHRDLTPANIFAARRGRQYDFVKVLDFGLVEAVVARNEDGSSRRGAAPGTPQYMAPEQITGDRAIDGRCDLYTLGGVAYTLLTGRPPFVGETADEVRTAQVREAVVPPSHHRPEIPPDLEEVVLRCLTKDPEARFQSAEDLEAGLASCTSASDWDARKAADWWREIGRTLAT